MKRETNNFLLGMLAGAAVGAASALLLAPMRGEEARNRLRDQMNKARRRATETSQQVQSRISMARERAAEAGSQMRETVTTARERMREAAATAVRGKVNLNSATRDELISIEGVGPAIADDIIAHRTEHGGFKSVDELENVYGLGHTMLSRIRDQVTV